MASYALLDDNNIVTQVITGNEEGGDTNYETVYGNFHGQTCKRTSYNTHANAHSDGGTPFRGNYAGIGHVYDTTNNVFYEAQPHASWTKDVATASWVAPITYPSVTNDGQDPVVFEYIISWNESGYQADNTKGWEATKSNDSGDPATIHDWNGSAWVSR